MRKSFAPSFQSSKVRSEGKTSINTVFSSSSNADGGTCKSARSTGSILNLLNERNESRSCYGIPCQQPPLENIAATSSHHTSPIGHCKKAVNTLEDFEGGENFHPLPSPDNVESRKRKFNVVWGKLSKKKHKKWEGDGVAEIGLHTVILKDCDGKVLGSTRGVKTDQLEEGSRLVVGGKEIELIDLIIQDDKEDEMGTKEGKLPKPEIHTASTRPAKKLKLMASKTFRNPNNQCQDSLVMPTPPSEHQQTSIGESADDDAEIDEYLSI